MVYYIKSCSYYYNYLRIKSILSKIVLIDSENGPLDTIKKFITRWLSWKGAEIICYIIIDNMILCFFILWLMKSILINYNINGSRK